MAPHSSTLAWKIPWAEEPGRLQSMGSLRVGHDWATSLSLFTFMHWRRQWQPTPVFLPGESQGRGSLVGCHLWGHTESDTQRLSSSSKGDLQVYHNSYQNPSKSYVLGGQKVHSVFLFFVTLYGKTRTNVLANPTDTKNVILQFIWKGKGTRIAKTILKKKQKAK